MRLVTLNTENYKEYFQLKCDHDDIYWSGFADKPNDSSFRKYFLNLIEKHDAFLAEVNDTIVGYIVIKDGSVGYGIAKAYRGRGLASHMLTIAPGKYAWVAEENMNSRKALAMACYKESADTTKKTFLLPKKHSRKMLLMKREFQIINKGNDTLSKRINLVPYGTNNSKVVGDMTKFLGSRIIGVAANQLGFLQRIAVINFPEGQKVMVNPEILARSEATIEGLESCLSIPGQRVTTTRPKEITVKFFDEAWNENEWTISGYHAKCVLHEIDHLDGILMDQRSAKL
jgi:peptide deformylase